MRLIGKQSVDISRVDPDIYSTSGRSNGHSFWTQRKERTHHASHVRFRARRRHRGARASGDRSPGSRKLTAPSLEAESPLPVGQERPTAPDRSTMRNSRRKARSFKVTTGPAVTFWNPANKASGDYTVKATFTEPKYMNLNNHPHPVRDLHRGQRPWLRQRRAISIAPPTVTATSSSAASARMHSR